MFNLWEAIKGNINSVYCLGSLLDFSDQQFRKEFSQLVQGVLLDSLWLLGELGIAIPSNTISFKLYMYIDAHIFIGISYSFR